MGAMRFVREISKDINYNDHDTCTPLINEFVGKPLQRRVKYNLN